MRSTYVDLFYTQTLIKFSDEGCSSPIGSDLASVLYLFATSKWHVGRADLVYESFPVRFS